MVQLGVGKDRRVLVGVHGCLISSSCVSGSLQQVRVMREDSPWQTCKRGMSRMQQKEKVEHWRKTCIVISRATRARTRREGKKRKVEADACMRIGM